MNWKSLEAYNYFQSGRVPLVKVFKARSCSILMALVNPSHRRVTPQNSLKYGRTQLEATKTCSPQTIPCSIVHMDPQTPRDQAKSTFLGI